MNFKEIIKQEWEAEFPNNGWPYEDSIFMQYEEMVQRICIKVWNSALDATINNVEVICDSSETFQGIDEQSILKLKL